MEHSDVLSQMCKSARAMGLPKSKWLKVEDKLSTILASSGLEFTLNYLKDMKDAKIEETVSHGGIIRWYPESDSRSMHNPRCWHKVGSDGKVTGVWTHLWNFRKPKTSIQILGAMINCIEFGAATEAQLRKWKKAVLESTPSKLRDVGKVAPFPKPMMDRLEKRLAGNMASQVMFSPSDIRSVNIPVNRSHISVLTCVRPKRSSRGKSAGPGAKSMTRSLEKTLQAYLASVGTAPPPAGDFAVNSLSVLKTEYPDLRIKDESARRKLGLYISAPLEQNWFLYRRPELESIGFSSIRDPKGEYWLEGQFRLLQKPGGKLRAVCAPNLYEQYVLEPLKKALGDTVNEYPAVVVRDQLSGIRWAQQKLRAGIELASFDLSSATDTLDSKAFIERVMKPNAGPLTRVFLDEFERASRGRWWNATLREENAFSVGQPLGLGPSFSMLSAMNLYAGLMAASQSGLDLHDSFRLCGDDFVCDARMAKRYAKLIEGMGGIPNFEKTLVSDKYAEFCSQMITKSTSFPLKPRIRGYMEAFFVDAEKTTLSRMALVSRYPKEFRSMGEYLCSWSSSDIGNLPSLVGDVPIRPISERASASVYLDYVSLVTQCLPDSREVALGAACAVVVQNNDRKDKFDDVVASVTRGSKVLSDYLSDRSVRAIVCLDQKVYDWKKDDYVAPVSDLSRMKKLYRHLQTIERNSELQSNGDRTIIGLTDPKNRQVMYGMLYSPDDGTAIFYIQKGSRQEIIDTVDLLLREDFATSLRRAIPDALIRRAILVDAKGHKFLARVSDQKEDIVVFPMNENGKPILMNPIDAATGEKVSTNTVLTPTREYANDSSRARMTLDKSRASAQSAQVQINLKPKAKSRPADTLHL
jgi:hypothetical protein